jgi:hypothetical protein
MMPVTVPFIAVQMNFHLPIPFYLPNTNAGIQKIRTLIPIMNPRRNNPNYLLISGFQNLKFERQSPPGKL